MGEKWDNLRSGAKGGMGGVGAGESLGWRSVGAINLLPPFPPPFACYRD
jgi:hypothetical protein